MEVQEDLLTDIETEINQETVSVGIRFANYVIDLLIFYILSVITGVVLASFIANAGTPLTYLISYILYVSYFTFIEGATNGRSVGKLITRSKAVKENGTPITWNDALMRSLSRIVPFEPFSAFGGQPWHDRWSHTKVVKQ
jgi:uncharacterized RDD family membrane protein YckC